MRQLAPPVPERFDDMPRIWIAFWALIAIIGALFWMVVLSAVI
jgi:hypothetical protein